jgi:hypothetical protein
MIARDTGDEVWCLVVRCRKAIWWKGNVLSITIEQAMLSLIEREPLFELCMSYTGRVVMVE